MFRSSLRHCCFNVCALHAIVTTTQDNMHTHMNIYFAYCNNVALPL